MGKTAKKQQADSVTSLLFDLGLYVGVMRGATGGDTGEEPEDKLNTYVTFAVDGFKHLLNKLNADRSAAEECRKRVDQFKDLWDQYYIRRDLLVDELSDALHHESLTGTPKPAEEALKRLESSVCQLVSPYADDGLRVYESGKALGMVKAVFVVTVCKAQADDIQPAIDNARKVLKALRLTATVQKKVDSDITAMRKEYRENAFGQGMLDLDDSIIGVADNIIEMAKSSIEAEISVSAPVMGDKSASPDESSNDRPGQPPKKPEDKIRVWAHDYCPNCGEDGIEWIRRKDFAEQANIKADTVGNRVKEGKYCSRADKKIPWCQYCKELTPEGKGEMERRSEPQVILTEEYQQKILDWWEEYRLDGSFVQGKGEDIYELQSEAFTAIHEACVKQGGEISKNKAMDMMESAVKNIRAKKIRQDYEAHPLNQSMI